MRTLTLIALLGVSGCFNKTPPEPVVPDGGAAATGASSASASGTTGIPGLPDAAQSAVLSEEQKAIARREKAKEATALLTTGKFEDSRRALALLKELEADLPDSATLAYNMGLAQEQLGNRAMAEQAYRRATQLSPELGAAWMRLGALAEAGGDINYASQVYGQGMRAAPEDMDLQVAAIGVLVRQGRLDEAETAAKKALGINANAQAIYANLALIYIQQDRLELGKFIINRAFNFVDGAQTNAHLHAYLGRIHFLQDHPFEARASYEKALEIDPELLDAMIFLSEVHLDNRAYSAMVPLLEQAVKVEPMDAAIHMNLGVGYRGMGRFEEAEKEYRKVIELAPGRPEPFLNLALLYGDHEKKYDEAMAILEQYKGMAGADIELADAWAVQYEEEKERAKRAEERKRRAEERKKKREEEQRFMEEFERKKQEEEARLRQLEEEQAAREAANPTPAPAPAPAAVPGTEAVPGATPGAQAAPGSESAPGPAAGPEAPVQPAAAPDVGPEAGPAAPPTPVGEAQPPSAAADAAPPAEAPSDGTAPAAPVSVPEDSTPEPAAPSQPAPGPSSEDAAGQPAEGAGSATEEPATPENPWGG